MLCYVIVMLCYVMLCYVVMLSYVMLLYVMLCYVMLCYVMLCSDYCSLHVRESKTVPVHSLESRSPDTGFQIPSINGSWIQDSSR